MLACTKAVSIKWGNSNFARTVWRFWLTACKYFSTTDDSNAFFEQCNVRVVLVVCRFSNHKCRHGKVYAARCKATHKKTVQVIIISNYVPTRCNKCIPMFVMGFIVLVSSRRNTLSQYGEGRNISVSRLRYSANHNAPDSWPISARKFITWMHSKSLWIKASAKCINVNANTM